MAFFETSDGLRLAYRDEGQGLPVLCLAGLTRNSDDFNFVAPHLKDVRLIRMDYRGRGASDYAPHATYTVAHEAQDALALLDHLKIEMAAILGTSRGGLIAMGLAAGARARLLGVCLNDIGPVIEPAGLDAIIEYLGRVPSAKTLDQAAQVRPKYMPGFANVPKTRWRQEVAHLFAETTDRLALRYDPHLRDAVIEAGAQPMPDLWPLFDALDGLPLALIHGENSDLLTAKTAAEMRRRKPDMLYACVKDRGHVPFLDEPESLIVINAWLESMQ